jgi:hypothetical protein
MSRKMMFAFAICIALAVVCMGSAALAQSGPDNLVVYAKAGRVNLLTGNVVIRHSRTDPGTAATAGAELADGDFVTTGADTRLEVLLSPGAYLRVGNNSEFQMISTAIDDVRIIMRRGSAEVETGGGPDGSFLIQMAMPSGTAMIEKSGVYRLNVDGKRSEVLVFAGATSVEPMTIKLKEGKRAAITSGVAEPVASFDKKTTMDGLDNWSQERAEYLAKANRGLNQTELAQAFNGRNSRDFSSARMTGYWVFSPQLGSSVFVPFNQTHFNSPYGFAYTIGSGGGWSVNNNPSARGTGDGPAQAVTPAGPSKGSNPATSQPTVRTP